MIKYIITFYLGIYLLIMSVCDLKSRQIPVLPGIVSIGIICCMQFFQGESWMNPASGAGVGILLLLLAKVTGGSIGSGDALVYIVTGTGLGFVKILDVLFLSLLMSAVVAGALFIFRHVGKKYAIPFVPFTAIAYGLVVLL